MADNSKILHLSFEKGLTNVPSDAVCDDQTLEESVGLIYMNGEHRVVQEPVKKATGLDGRLLFVHKFNEQERWIVQTENELIFGSIRDDGSFWKTAVLTEVSNGDDIRITSVGKTMIVKSNGLLRYYIWKGEKYEAVSATSGLPDVKMEFKMLNNGHQKLGPEHGNGGIGARGIGSAGEVVDESLFRDFIAGNFNVARNNIYRANQFMEPFYVRYALKMADNTYANVSEPILMMPFHHDYFFWMGYNVYLHDDVYSYLFMSKASMLYRFNELIDSDIYGDIIKGITVFVSRPVCYYHTSNFDDANYRPWHQFEDIDASPRQVYKVFNNKKTVAADITQSFSAESVNDLTRYHEIRISGDTAYAEEDKPWYGLSQGCLKHRSSSAIDEDLKNPDVFYVLFDIPLSEMSTSWQYTEDKASENRMGSIASGANDLGVLGNDYYFSKSQISGASMTSYNSRLYLCNIGRSIFEGSSYFMPNDRDSIYHYTFYVTIRTDDGNIIVKHEESSNQLQGYYYFYPDSRAKHIMIFESQSTSDEGGCILDADLIESRFLNGAYYFAGYDNLNGNGFAEQNLRPPLTNENYLESFENYIYASEVNNPWQFEAGGQVRIGNGTILAMSTITQDLSQNKFGSFPLIAFSTDGIWALEIDGEGLIKNVVPKSREVLNNVKSVTPTDREIFFSTASGLMVIDSNGVVRCVSEQLSGRVATQTQQTGLSFVEYLKGAFMAYDYRDRLLWICNSAEKYGYVYSIQNEAFSTVVFTEHTDLPALNVGYGGVIGGYIEIKELPDLEGAPLTNPKVYYSSHLDKYVWRYVRNNIGVYLDMPSNFTTPGLFDGGRYYWDGSKAKRVVEAFTGSVNNYPDTLLLVDDEVYSLLERPDINEDENWYAGKLVSRPMKLEDGMTLKTIRQLKHVFDFHEGEKIVQNKNRWVDDHWETEQVEIVTVPYPVLSVRLYASNDLKHWTQLQSLHGTPWKYYRLTYVFENLKATDTFTGTVVRYQTRFTNKLR